MEYTQWWESHLQWFWIMPFLVMVLMFIFVAYRVRRAGGCGLGSRHRTFWMPFGCCSPRQSPRTRWWAETPRQILDRRYASGEITNEEYERIKRDMESSQSQHEPSNPS